MSVAPETLFEPFCVDDGQSIEVKVDSAESMYIVLYKNKEVVAYSHEQEEGRDDHIILRYKDKVNDGDAEFELKSFSA